jgi:predicted nucleic acid-binding protein
MVTHPIFDTNTVIEYKHLLTKFLRIAYFPSIVFFELVSTSINQDELKLYSDWHRNFAQEFRILTPTENDWWETAKAIRRMYINKTAPQTKLVTLKTDALIARLSVKKKGSFIVTNDVDDFLLIKREMDNLRVISADAFFA